MILEEDGEPMTIENAIEELFGAVMTAMDPDGRLYSYDFRLLPSREVKLYIVGSHEGQFTILLGYEN